MNRRQALKSVGTLGALGLPWFSPFPAEAGAQTSGIDWAARVSSLPRPQAGEVVITAVGDLDAEPA